MDITKTDYLASLNEAQLEAVMHRYGPLLILAGAGTGKTRTLTARIANLIETGEAFPSQILAVTFTNKASREMLERLEQYIPIDGIWLGTFHSIAARILRRHSNVVGLSPNFNILDESDQLRLVKKICEQENITDDKNLPKILAATIRGWKDRNLNISTIECSNNLSSIEFMACKIYHIYQRRLKELDSVDFADLLLLNLTLFETDNSVLQYYQHKFKFIQVDEYQDTNQTQYMWLRLLAAEHNNICCVGDDDQSIYGWRGANVNLILDFPKHFSGTNIIKLEQNYRSTKAILGAASVLISQNEKRHGKTLWTETDGGDKIKLIELVNERDEANYIVREVSKLLYQNNPNFSVGILVRSTVQTRVLEESFTRYNVAYRLIGGLRFYDRQEIKDAIAYIRISLNQDDDLAFERIINTPRRGIGEATIALINQYARERQISLTKATANMLEEGLLKGKNAVSLRNFLENITNWGKTFDTLPAHLTTEKILNESGYMNMWKQSKNNEAESKLDNISELLQAIEEAGNISNFLENASLANNINENNSHIQVTIMTLHAAKGLEFDAVYLPGWEEGLFPHARSIEEGNVEEERRLAYVGITRARYYLTISYVQNRYLYNRMVNRPSRFISELPDIYLEKINLGYQMPSEAHIEKAPERRNITNISSQGKILRIGQRVSHHSFGEGLVMSLRNDAAEIVFFQAGRKLVKLQFLNW